MRRRHVMALALMAVVVGAASQLPLSWFSGVVSTPNGVDAPELSGTVWAGQVKGLPGLPTMETDLNPLKLLGGFPLRFSGQSQGLSLQGEVGPGRLNDVRYSAELNALPIRDGRLIGLSGRIDINISDARFGGSCETITGSARTDVLSRNQARWQWSGPELSGPLTCDNGDVLVALEGSDVMSTITAGLRVRMDGTYQLDTQIESRDSKAALVLPLMGFEVSRSGYRLTEQGQWQ